MECNTSRTRAVVDPSEPLRIYHDMLTPRRSPQPALVPRHESLDAEIPSAPPGGSYLQTYANTLTDVLAIGYDSANPRNLTDRSSTLYKPGRCPGFEGASRISIV